MQHVKSVLIKWIKLSFTVLSFKLLTRGSNELLISR